MAFQTNVTIWFLFRNNCQDEIRLGRSIYREQINACFDPTVFKTHLNKTSSYTLSYLCLIIVSLKLIHFGFLASMLCLQYILPSVCKSWSLKSYNSTYQYLCQVPQTPSLPLDAKCQNWSERQWKQETFQYMPLRQTPLFRIDGCGGVGVWGCVRGWGMEWNKQGSCFCCELPVISQLLERDSGGTIAWLLLTVVGALSEQHNSAALPLHTNWARVESVSLCVWIWQAADWDVDDSLRYTTKCLKEVHSQTAL